MKLTLTNLSIAALAIVAVLYASFLFANPFTAGAEDATQIPAVVATTSVAGVTTSASTIFATSSCTGRVISTRESAIMLTFSDNQGQVPTGLYGHVQAASTTVAYDAGTYGCGAFKAFSFTAQNLTLMETR